MATTSVDKVTQTTLLWTNSNPTVAFSAQTISLDLSNYDAVKIVALFVDNTNSAFTCELPVGSTDRAISYFFLLTETSSDAAHFINGVSRSASVDTNGIVFGRGQMVYNSSAYVDWDNRAIPWKIYGIKY